LAQAAEKKQTSERQLVVFTLATEEFGIEINQVKEIIQPREITRLPHTPEFIRGVINLRGEIIPVLDLRTRFNVDAREIDRDSRIIVVEIAGTVAGLLVDSVTEVLRIDGSQIEDAPRSIAGLKAEFLQGVGKIDDRLLILLEVNKILSTQEEIQLQTQVELAASGEED